MTGYGPDSVAYYSCDYGYDIYGPKSRKCQYDGSWYGDIPVCRPKRSKFNTANFYFQLEYFILYVYVYVGDCSKLYAPKHGKIRVTGYGPDSLAYYSCDYGYALYGPSSRKCQYDGSWYGKIPVCRPKRKSKLTSVKVTWCLKYQSFTTKNLIIHYRSLLQTVRSKIW